MILSKFANKSFLTRLLSGIVLVALILATIIPGGIILLVANMLISLVGVYELYRVLGIEKKLPGITGICGSSYLLWAFAHGKNTKHAYTYNCISYVSSGTVCIYVPEI